MAEPALPPGVAIHDLRAADAPPGALEAASHAVWQYWLDVTSRPWPEQRAAWLEAPSGDTLPIRLGAIADGKCVGTVSLVACDLAQRPDLAPWVASVLVWPAWRGRGLGVALMAAIEQAAAACGYDAAYLFTPDAEAFYARLRWSAFDYDLARGQEVVIMRKAIG